MALPLFSLAVAGRVCIRPGERVGVSSSRGDFTGPLAGATRLICVSCFCHYRFALASHFFWGLWSIVQAKISSIEFGYMVRLGGSFSLLPPGENATVYVNALVANDRSLQRVTGSPQVPEPGDLAPRQWAQPRKPQEEGPELQPAAVAERSAFGALTPRASRARP